MISFGNDGLILPIGGDPFYKDIFDISQVNPVIIDRMRNYFLSYKSIPSEATKT